MAICLYHNVKYDKPSDHECDSYQKTLKWECSGCGTINGCKCGLL